MADVTQADDGVAGADALAPSRHQVPVHLLDAPEQAVPDEQDRAVGQVQVGPDPGPLGRSLDDRDRRSLHRSGQLPRCVGNQGLARRPRYRPTRQASRLRRPREPDVTELSFRTHSRTSRPTPQGA